MVECPGFTIQTSSQIRGGGKYAALALLIFGAITVVLGLVGAGCTLGQIPSNLGKETHQITVAAPGSEATLKETGKPEPLARPPTLAATDVKDMQWSPDGAKIATIHGPGAITMWDLPSMESLYELPGPKIKSNFGGAQTRLVFNPFGDRFAASTAARVEPNPAGGRPLVRTAITIFETNNGDTVRTLEGAEVENDEVGALSWSPDERMIAASSWLPGAFSQGTDGMDSRVILWEAETGQKLGTLENPRLPDMHTWLSNTRLAVAYRDGTVIVWDTEVGEAVEEYPRDLENLDSIALSPDGSLLAVGLRGVDSHGLLRVLQVPTGRELYTLEMSGYTAFGLAFSKDSRRLAVMTPNPEVVLILEAANGKESARLDWPQPGSLLRWSPDGSALAILAPSGIILWRVDTY